jgi:acetolactate synthase-1/2/3 large subunit
VQDELRSLLQASKRPLIIAGGAFDQPGGREALLAFARRWHIPVAVAFRRHDLFPNRDALFVGDLGLSNPAHQIEAFQDSDLILALGTRLDDITSQGYAFPDLPQPRQVLVHCHPDPHVVGLHFAPQMGLVCDPVSLVKDLSADALVQDRPARQTWSTRLRDIHEAIARWPQREVSDGVDFAQVVRALAEQAPSDVLICLDAGTFAAPIYRHFPFEYPQRLMAPLSGAMGYGTPAAIAAQLRHPTSKVVCLVGDGGFMMTGNEMIAAVERRLPILFIVSNNRSFASIRIHQERSYPGRTVGTDLFNPDFVSIAQAFGMAAQRIDRPDQIDAAISQGLASDQPCFIEVSSSLAVSLPQTAA